MSNDNNDIQPLLTSQEWHKLATLEIVPFEMAQIPNVLFATGWTNLQNIMSRCKTPDVQRWWLLPLRGVDAPAIVLELKWNKSADTAIAQIKRQEYAGALSAFSGEILLVGISYNKKTKKHECRIERLEKTQVVAGENFRSSRENLRSKKMDLIVDFCSVPRSLEEIALHLKVSGKYYMKQQYIDPILGTRLRMTEPDSPTSPTQKYVAR